MDSRDVVAALWQRTQQRDWKGVAALVAEDVTVEWPVTGETFKGRDNYTGVNREYPEGWEIEMIRIVADPDGEQVVAEVAVPHAELGDFRTASFFTVRDGLVVDIVEYWTTPGSETPPEWRAKFSTAGGE